MASINREVRANGKVRYTVSWYTDHGRRRKYFRTREEAEAYEIPDARPPIHKWANRDRGPFHVLPICEAIRASVLVSESGCWEWQRSKTREGYGKVPVPGVWLAHRAAWIAFRGPIPEGYHVDHLCRNRACCNPDHLEPVTPQENVLRSPVSQAALNAAKTHCPKGHPYDEENTYRGRKSGRQCRTCLRVANHATYLRRKELAHE